MPPKVASKPKVKSSSDHVTYQDMIIDAIVTLKERNGSSRVALKKYIKANNQNLVDGKMFDSLFNRALKSGVEKGVFAQPRGSSGGTKLAKKEPKPSSSKLVAKPIEAKEPEKKAVVKKSAPKKIASEPVKEKAKEKVVRESEDEDEEEEEVAPKPKASRSTKAKAPSKPKRASKETPVKETPVVVHRTKSGRIIKSTATPTKTVTPNKATSKSKDKS